MKVELRNVNNYELDYYSTDLVVVFDDLLTLTLNLDALIYYHSEGRRGLFPLLSRGEAKKRHSELRRKLGLDKKEYCRVMGKVGGLLSRYLASH